MGMPSNGVSGMNFVARGKEYRNYKPTKLKQLDEYNPIFYENNMNESLPLTYMKKKNLRDGRMRVYEEPTKKYGYGALIKAQAAGLMKAAGIDDEEKEEIMNLLHPKKLPRKQRIGKQLNGKGVAFNKKELEKLKGKGVLDWLKRRNQKRKNYDSDSEEEEDDDYDSDLDWNDRYDSEDGDPEDEEEESKKIDVDRGIQADDENVFVTPEAMTRIARFLKYKIKKGRKIPPEIIRLLLKMRSDPEYHKYLLEHRMRKYIDFDESGGAIVKRGGSWWGLALKGVETGLNLLNSGAAAYTNTKNALDTFKNRKVEGENRELSNEITNYELKKQKQRIDRERAADFLKKTGEGCKRGGNRLSKEEFLERMRRGKEAKKRQRIGGSLGTFVAEHLFTDVVIPGKTVLRQKQAERTKRIFSDFEKLSKKGKGATHYSKDEEKIQEAMDCDNHIVADTDNSRNAKSIQEFTSQLQSYTNIPPKLIKPIYEYGYLNKPTSAVECSKANAIMNQLDQMNNESYKYYDSYEQFENNIDQEGTKYSIIFHTNPSNPQQGHFEAAINHGNGSIEYYSSLGNKPNFSSEFMQSHHINYNNIQHQKTSENANGCLWYCLLFLCSKSHISPC